MIGVSALSVLLAAYPTLLSWSGQGVEWNWVRHSPRVERMSMAAQADATAVQSIIEAHPLDWGGVWAEGDGIAVATVTRDVPAATAYLRALDISGPLRVVQVVRSYGELEALVITLSDGLNGDWGPVVMFGPQYSRNAVIVEMQWPDPRMLLRLRDIARSGVIGHWSPGVRPQLHLATADLRP